jgi:predicted extracellular nuclease
MKKFLYAVSVAALLWGCQPSPKTVTDGHVTVAFYNVENLFDTIQGSNPRDKDFIPTSKKKWNSKRYLKKVNDIGKVLSSINSVDLPEVIGLCEVENRSVLEDLVASSNLKKGNYKIAHIESPDYRGIDVAMIYRPAEFEFISQEALAVTFPDAPNYTTRDILYVKGKLDGEVYHLFVNHWPSRRGGMEKSEPKRVQAAAVLKKKVDEIKQKDANARIIIMGDMNDEPSNKSLAETLGASEKPNTSGLFNMMYDNHLAKTGSYNFRGNWNMIDNMVVSDNLLTEGKLKTTANDGNVFHERFMEYHNKKFKSMSPSRTFGGNNYYGGISDHFPIYFELKK